MFTSFPNRKRFMAKTPFIPKCQVFLSLSFHSAQHPFTILLTAAETQFLHSPSREVLANFFKSCPRCVCSLSDCLRPAVSDWRRPEATVPRPKAGGPSLGGRGELHSLGCGTTATGGAITTSLLGGRGITCTPILSGVGRVKSPSMAVQVNIAHTKKTRWSPRTRMQTRSKSYICPNDTLVGHSCGTLLWVTLVGHSCGTLLWDTPVGHSCGILLWGTLVGHSCRTLLWDTLVGQSCGTLLQDTLVGHS